MQSKKFVDGTVSPKLNFRALAEKVIEKNKSVIKKLGKKKNKVKPVEAVAVAKGTRLKSTVVSNKENGEKKRVDWGGVLNNLVTTAGATVTGVFASKHAASQPQIQQAPRQLHLQHLQEMKITKRKTTQCYMQASAAQCC